MKLKTFKKTILELKLFYEEATLRDKRIEQALGGETVVWTDWWSSHLETGLDILSKDMNDKNGVIDWLFWESMNNKEKYLEYSVGNYVYEGNPENVWLDLKGKDKIKKPIRNLRLSLTEENKVTATQISEKIIKVYLKNIYEKDIIPRMNKILYKSLTIIENLEIEKVIKNGIVRVKGESIELTLDFLDGQQDIIIIRID